MLARTTLLVPNHNPAVAFLCTLRHAVVSAGRNEYEARVYDYWSNLANSVADHISVFLDLSLLCRSVSLCASGKAEIKMYVPTLPTQVSHASQDGERQNKHRKTTREKKRHSVSATATENTPPHRTKDGRSTRYTTTLERYVTRVGRTHARSSREQQQQRL